MKVILSGVAGFIGSNLTQKLLDAGHSVVGIDNLSFGNLHNIEPFKKNKAFEFHERDLRNEKAFAGIKGDILVHLASQKIPRYTNALCTLDDNSHMLRNAVKKCIDDKIKILYASTSDIYGKNPDVPYSEESDMLLGPTTVKRWAYAVSKIYGEQYIMANSDEYGLEYTITRFFGSYGPNQNLTWWGGPQSVFIGNAMLGLPIEIHGNGSQTRTFTYVDDTVQGIEKAMFDANARNEIFNVANNPDEEISILALGKLIWRLVNGEKAEPLINYVPYQTFGKYEDVPRRVPDISKIRSLLNFKPRYSLREGLELTINWQRKLSVKTK